MTDPTPDPDEDRRRQLDRAAAKVAGWLARLIDPGQVVELRALKMDDGRSRFTAAGTFHGGELPDLARAALTLSGNCQGVYYTLNPLRAERLVHEAPRVRRRGEGELARDADVLARRWVLVDVDPVRPAGLSATDAEKAAARDVAGRVRAYLTAEGWPAPVVADSGNGYHLLYRLAEDLPVETLPLPPGDRIRSLLRHLAERFDTAEATIDTSVYNPARIVKLPGTLACKGENLPDRPHRRAKVLEVPE